MPDVGLDSFCGRPWIAIRMFLLAMVGYLRPSMAQFDLHCPNELPGLSGFYMWPLSAYDFVPNYLMVNFLPAGLLEAFACPQLQLCVTGASHHHI